MNKFSLFGTWVSKVSGEDNESHYYLGNASICNTSQLLIPKPESYILEFYTPCKVCLKLLKNAKKRTEIESYKKELQRLYNSQIISPENAITNFITAPENIPADYTQVKRIFDENFPEFSFEDIISFMVLNEQLSLQNNKVLPIVEEEILS